MTAPRRIAVLGLFLECNAFAPPLKREDFARHALYYGDELTAPGSMLGPYLDPQGVGFGGAMSKLCEWTPVPVMFGYGGAGGPCDHEFFLDCMEQMRSRLRAALPLDGVFIVGHGAGTTTQIDDLDGAYFAAVREAVGPRVPVIATLDLHGNVSRQMVESTDVLVSYLTNPHVDMLERAAEAARLMHEMFEGMRPHMQLLRLPLAPPGVAQLTAPGHPYGDLIRYGQTKTGGDIANVSILSGFPLSDIAYGGMSIVVTARSSAEAARACAQELAQVGWNDRHRYVVQLTSISEAVARAVANDGSPIILADVADNPGGGGRGNTTDLLAALIAADAQGVQAGLFYDPELVREAQSLGVGARFVARFNRAEASPLSKPMHAQAEVLALTDGRFQGRRGTIAGTAQDLGACCLLRIGGVQLAVISIRQQLYSAEALEHFGLDPAQARCIVVKSRGHFRAGFSHIAGPGRIFEVDAPGLATPNLATVPWRHLPRPMYPMDPDTVWDASAA